MTTKKEGQIFKKQLSVVDRSDNDISSQFFNLNLNQGRKCPSPIQPFSKSNNDKYSGGTVKHGYKEERKTWNKSPNNSSLKTSNSLQLSHEGHKEKENQKRWKNDKNQKKLNSSTLSLHIAAYENSIESVTKSDTKNLHPKSEASKFVDPLSKLHDSQDLLEFPRQMEENESQTRPQVQQFSASQRLFSPNQDMQKYIPGALGAFLAGETTPTSKKHLSGSTTKAKKRPLLKKEIQQLDEENVVPIKKAKAEKKKSVKPKKAVKTEESKSLISKEDDSEEELRDETAKPGVMKLKPKKPEEEDIKVKREKAKLKKKDIIKQRANAADREIFVGNVPASVRRREIEQVFKKYGEIEKVWSRSVVGLSEKKTRTLARKYKKIGSNVLDVINFYIRYKSPDSVAKALEMNGSLFKGLHLRVTVVNKKSLSVGFSAFVSNLPFDITEEEIHQHFNDCGDIKAIRVMHDKFSGLCKGVAFVEFSEKESVEKAIKKNGTTLKEREIRVAKALKRKQLAKEFATKTKKSKDKQKEAEKMQAKIADYVVQKKPVGKNVTKNLNAKKPAGKAVAKDKKFKKAKKGPVKSIMV